MSLFIALVGLVVLAVVIIVAVVQRRDSNDQMFVGLAPGMVPRVGEQAERTRLKTGEYRGTVPVQFQPPRGVAPGLVGTVIDGRAEMRDVTATIVDLAVRGFLKIEPITPPEGNAKAKKDWLLTADPTPPTEVRPFERRLLMAMFGQGPTVRMSDLQHGFGAAMREAQVDLYRQVVDNGWYPRHPQAKGGGLKKWGAILIVASVLVLLGVFYGVGVRQLTPVAALGPFAGIMAGVIALVVGRGVRVARTAEGTAVMIQSLGFKQYLATAEAGQIKFEEASDIFSRYLPYAIVFGVAQHWAKVFGDVAKRYHEMKATGQLDYGVGDLVFDLMWFDMWTPGDLTGDLVGGMFDLGDAISGIDMADIGDVFGAMGDGAGEVFGAFTDGVSGFVDSAGDFDLGALDGCDLDLGGCDF